MGTLLDLCVIQQLLHSNETTLHVEINDTVHSERNEFTNTNIKVITTVGRNKELFGQRMF